ncbi:MAG: small ribosomal subunit biogenesis GTPase RsgA [Gammaproteobacteria bacterium]|nr:small ribosomal subunit biogenesis GTPase RsgA [Gammaproteobacteria bacterium]
MAKRRLSNQQSRRIQNKRKHIQQSGTDLEADTGSLASEVQSGLVIANHGKHLIIETEQRTQIRCVARPTLETVVSGDRVLWQAIESDPESGVVVALQARKSLLQRPGFGGKVKPVAANIDRMFIITASLPELNEGMLDRYLVSAEASDIEAIIVFNKTDLLGEAQLESYEQRLTIYRELGYKLIFTSTKRAHGMDELLAQLRDKTSILVGQSGVGKSSLVNLLLPEETIKIGDISEANRKGGHTTTATRLYHLAQGGDLIDSPGVREFGLVQIERVALSDCYREFRQYSANCRFRDCNHRDAKACAVIEAVQAGKITQKRYQSYLRILESLEQGNR